MEALANVFLAGLFLIVFGSAIKKVPYKSFAMAGSAQVFAKGFTTCALNFKVAYPIVTLAKSGKMVPVMIGSLLLGGASYSAREYASVAAIIGGTCIVSMQKIVSEWLGLGSKKVTPSSPSDPIGLAFLLAALMMDGVSGGMQNGIKVWFCSTFWHLLKKKLFTSI